MGKVRFIGYIDNCRAVKGHKDMMLTEACR